MMALGTEHSQFDERKFPCIIRIIKPAMDLNFSAMDLNFRVRYVMGVMSRIY